MRKLIGLVVVLAVLWAGYWFVGSSGLQRGVNTWFAEQAAAGMTAENSGVTVRGFPNRFDLTVDNVKFADPKTGLGWEAPFVQIFALSYKPWHVISALPNSQVLRLPGQEMVIDSQDLRASARATPNSALPLEEIVIEGAALKATSTLGWQLASEDLIAAIRVDATTVSSYDVVLTATGVTPDPALMAALKASSDLPPMIQTLTMDINTRLNLPLDRFVNPPTIRLAELTVKNIGLTWGDMTMTSAGVLKPDRAGFLEGRVEIEITKWQKMIPLLVASGAVKPEVAPTIENLLGALARDGGNPDVLKVPLVMAEGLMSLGPLPLGAAPNVEPPTN
ncbi:MAG: DUF2125 domain-containing protein [Tabrizicola sp.]|nr:DUF2125 domain-containing protein [Tabrizicola sp.]